MRSHRARRPTQQVSEARIRGARLQRERVHAVRVAWAPSPLRRALRHPLVRAGALVALGILASLTWSAKVTALDEQRARWGELAEVMVVVGHVDIGAPLAGAVETRELPLAVVPANAISDVGSGAVAKTPLYEGEILLADRITDTDPFGPPPGTVAVTLSTVATTPLVDRGDLIDVWLVDSANLSSRRIARNVLVLSLDSDEITIAVPEPHVAETTAAALRPVVITLVG